MSGEPFWIRWAHAVGQWCKGAYWTGVYWFRGQPRERLRQWEAVKDEDGLMWRVRWSEPDACGRYLWVGHYAVEANGESWAHMAAERHAERFNEQGRIPCEFGVFQVAD